MIAKTLGEIAKMVANLADDPSIEQGVLDHAQKTRFVFMLIGKRIDQNLSQRELAKKMGYTPSRLSRMEASADADLKFGDILAYTRALGVNMNISLESEKQPAAHRIKGHVAAIHTLLEELCELAKHVGREDVLAAKIKEFYGEVLLNFLLGYVKNYDALPDNTPLRFPAKPLPPKTNPKPRAPARKSKMAAAAV